MTLLSTGESKQAYADYLKTLLNDGFMELGYGVYAKADANATLQVETDGAWKDDATLQLVFIIVPNE